MNSIFDRAIESRTAGVFAARFVSEMPAGSIDAPFPLLLGAPEPLEALSVAALLRVAALSRATFGVPTGTASGLTTGTGVVTGGGTIAGARETSRCCGSVAATRRDCTTASGFGGAGVGRRIVVIASCVSRSREVNLGIDHIEPNASANDNAVMATDTMTLGQRRSACLKRNRPGPCAIIDLRPPRLVYSACRPLSTHGS
jgi:hypothetical protein